MAGKFPMSITEMKSLSQDYYFSKDTIRFWNSVVLTSPDQYGLFIEAVDNWNRTKRIFSVKSFDPYQGKVWTLTNFKAEEYDNLKKAKEFLGKVEAALDTLDSYRELSILKQFSHIEPRYEDPAGIWEIIATNGDYFVVNTNNFSRFVAQ